MKSAFLLPLILGSILGVVVASNTNAQVVLDMPAPPAAKQLALTPISVPANPAATAQLQTVQSSPAPGSIAIARYSSARRAPSYSYDMPRRRNYSYSYYGYGYGNYLYGYPWYGWWGGWGGCFGHSHCH